MIACPYCREPAMSAWEKLRIGPRHSVPCRACTRKVSVSKAAVLAVIAPVIIGAIAAHLSTSLALGAASILAGGIAALLLYVYAVPLVERK